MDLIDVRARTAEVSGAVLAAYPRCLYVSHHTTAGYLPQSLSARLAARPEAIGSYFDLLRTMFPEGAGYRHDSNLDKGKTARFVATLPAAGHYEVRIAYTINAIFVQKNTLP